MDDILTAKMQYLKLGMQIDEVLHSLTTLEAACRLAADEFKRLEHLRREKLDTLQEMREVYMKQRIELQDMLHVDTNKE